MSEETASTACFVTRTCFLALRIWFSFPSRVPLAPYMTLLHGELPWYILLWEATYPEGMVRSRAHVNALHIPAHCAPSFQANLS